MVSVDVKHHVYLQSGITNVAPEMMFSLCLRQRWVVVFFSVFCCCFCHPLAYILPINVFSPAFAKAVIMLRLYGRLGYTNRHHHNLVNHNLGHLTKSKLADSLSAGSSDDAIFRFNNRL